MAPWFAFNLGDIHPGVFTVISLVFNQIEIILVFSGADLLL